MSILAVEILRAESELVWEEKWCEKRSGVRREVVREEKWWW